MIRTRAAVDDRIRIIVPNVDTMRVLPPGTTIEVESYTADQPMSAMVRVTHVPEAPAVYNIVIPKGASVNVVSE